MSSRDSSTPGASAPPQTAPPHYLEEDTISLIDLLAVLIRHRLLIIIGTLVALVGAIIYVSVGPGAAPEEAAVPEIRYTVRQDLLVLDLPEAAATYLNLEPAPTVAQLLENPAVVAAAWAQAYDDDRAQSSPALLQADVAQLIGGGDYTVSNSGAIISLSWSDTDRSAAEGFISALNTAVADELASQLGPLAAETAALAPEDSPARALLSRLGTDPGSLLVPLGTSTAEERIAPEEGTDPAMIVVIATITALFLFIFLAFVLEYVGRVKQEPEEMEKLKAAWKGQDQTP